jgi:hypothetical protein
MTKTKFTDEILSLRQACCQQRSQRERDLHSSVKMDAGSSNGPKDEIRTRMETAGKTELDTCAGRTHSFFPSSGHGKKELGKLNGMSRVGGGKAEV